VTPAQQAELMTVDPGWDFTNNPASAISHASISAATAYGHGSLAVARHWTEVGLRLVQAADSPHYQVGASLGELAQTLGVHV